MRVAAVLMLAFVAAASTASAASVEELFQQFGLFGVWAPNCAQEVGPGNPYVRIAMPNPGQVIEEHDLGPSYAINRYDLISAERLSEDDLAVDVMFSSGNSEGERQRLVFRVHKGTRRTMFNQPDGGDVRVKEGIVLARGSKTPVLNKCE